MPRGDGSGPGRGTGMGGSSRLRGNRAGAGAGGSCECPQCGTLVPHKQGSPCFNEICPKCGSQMMRQR